MSTTTTSAPVALLIARTRQLDRPGPRSCGASGDRGGFQGHWHRASMPHGRSRPGPCRVVSSPLHDPWESACVTSRRRASAPRRCAAGAVDAGPPLLPHRPDRSRVLVGRAPELRGRAHALAAPPTGVVPVLVPPARAQMVGVGSIPRAPAARVLRGRVGKRAHPRPTAAPAQGPFPGGARRLTKERLGLTGDVALGDAGLLASSVLARPGVRWELGVVQRPSPRSGAPSPDREKPRDDTLHRRP